MSLTIPQIRKLVLGQEKTVTLPVNKSHLLDFLGKTSAERADNLARIIFQKKTNITSELIAKRNTIFYYIINFWEKSLVEIPYKADTIRGINLARRPFFAPSAFTSIDTFGFYEQYRWDTYFQNIGILLAGGYQLAIDQLLNFVDVFKEFKRIPNALVSSYLSHGQPPFEALAVFAILESGGKPGEWVNQVMHMVEEDLLTEWWDLESGKGFKRQTEDIVGLYGHFTRYTPIHRHVLLASCEDGKDHNWTTVKYGSRFLPVQLNAVIYTMLVLLKKYYADKSLGNDTDKEKIYKDLLINMRSDFHKLFWCEKGKWKGFRNFSIVPGEEGHILYGDLSSEIFPLYCKLASQEQAEIIRYNLREYYKGDFGLATTSLHLRKGGTIEREPFGYWGDCQWEYPNCWPPLMYIAVQGLKNYGFNDDALEYEYDWVNHLENEFKLIGGFPEKTVYSSQLSIAEGFYQTVKGFGWTIAVYLSFLKDLNEAGRLI